MANNVMGMFHSNQSDKKGHSGVGMASGQISNVKLNDNTNDSMSNIPPSDLHVENLPSSSTLPPTKDGQRKTSTFGNSNAT